MSDKILVVDDEPDTLNLAKMILEEEGFHVITATDGDDALQIVNTEWPDLVLSDLVMPGKSGLEFCRIIKNDPNTKPIPVVIFTVLGRDVDKKLCEDAGAEGHLIKPFTQESLISEINEHLKKTRSEKFSKSIGLKHKQLKGHNILFEFDPASQYERVIRDFALESQAQIDKVVIITPKSSIIFKLLGEEKNIEFIPSTEIILSPILEAHSDKQLALVYDNLSELIISMGFQQAYNFSRKTLELLAEYDSTALFLFNPKAHSSNDTNSMRNLFNDRIAYDKKGLVVIKIT